MVLHRNNFEIPAEFIFQPFEAKWEITNAELEGWVENPPTLRMAFFNSDTDPRDWVRVRIELPEPRMSTRQMLGIDPLFETVLMDRVSVPLQVLSISENHRNTSDISGRRFRMLISFPRKGNSKARNSKTKRMSRSDLSLPQPGSSTKNAWIMLDSFLNLDTNDARWESELRCFLNKWGLWNWQSGFVQDWTPRTFRDQRPAGPEFVLVSPHYVKKRQEEYRSAILAENGRSWLAKHAHTLGLVASEGFPFYRVHKNYCEEAMEAAITILHLNNRKFGICKRCGAAFEQESDHKMIYCKRTCASAASVKRWREKQREAAKKGAKRNAKG